MAPLNFIVLSPIYDFQYLYLKNPRPETRFELSAKVAGKGLG